MTKGHVEAFAGHMVGAAEDRVRSWPSRGTIDAVSQTRALALDVLGRSLFALDLAGRAARISRRSHAAGDPG